MPNLDIFAKLELSMLSFFSMLYLPGASIFIGNDKATPRRPKGKNRQLVHYG
jgi:hypothetical protein